MSLLLLAVAVPALAGMNIISKPVDMYIRSTHALNITKSNGAYVGGLSDGTFAVDFSDNMRAGTVPTCWPSWGNPPDVETKTPRVLCSNGATSMTWDFNIPLRIFGVELAPRSPAMTATVTIRFMNQGTVVGCITRDLVATSGRGGSCGCPGTPGNGGALLFAAEACDQRFTSVEIDSTTPFGAAQIRYATYLGNVLTYNGNTGNLELGTTDIPKSGWYPLEAPSGAFVYIVTAKAGCTVTG
ncbi:MAG TPA: hypothetical protein VGM23_18475, partial [Armatimonadota bacterium]